MIRVGASLTWPWSNRFRLIASRFGSLGKNKAWEFNTYSTNDIVRVDLRYSVRCDHAGVFVEVGLLGFALELSWYDVRHWDSDKRRWRNH